MSIWNSFKSVISSIGSTLANIYNVLPGSKTYTIGGSTAPTQPTPASPYLQSGVPLSSQPVFTQSGQAASIAKDNSGKVLYDTTVNNIAQKQADIKTYQASGGVANYSPGYTPPPLSTPDTSRPYEMRYDNNGNASIFYFQGESGAAGTSSQQFGQGSGTSTIEGGAQGLPTALSGGTRVAGTAGLGTQVSVPSDTNKYLQFAGSPDIFEKTTGKVLTEPEAKAAGIFGLNGELKGVQVITSPRPFVTQESQFAQAAGKGLSAQELSLVNKPTNIDINSKDLTAAETGDTEKDLNSLRDKIMQMIEMGVTTQKQFTEVLKTANDDKLKAEADLRALELNDIKEIEDIVNDPDFSKRLQQRRLDFMNNPQNPKWLLRIELNQKIANATAAKTNVIEEFNLTRQMNQDQMNNAISMLNMIKPDSLGLKTDAEGNLYNIDRDPLSGKITKILIGSGYEKQKSYSDFTVQEVNGRKIAITVGMDGSITQKDLGVATKAAVASDGTTHGVTAKNWAALVISGQASLTNVPVGQRSEVVNLIAQQPEALLSDKDRDKLNVLDNALNVVNTLKDLQAGIAPSNALTRLVGGPLNWIQAKTQTGTKETIYANVREGFLSNVVRALGEKGTLNEGDIQRAINVVPGIGDTKAVADKKFETLINILDMGRQSIIKTSTKPASELSGTNNNPSNPLDPMGLY